MRLLSDASAVHACFVYLLDRDGKRLVLRAASAPYAHLAELGDGSPPRVFLLDAPEDDDHLAIGTGRAKAS